METPKLALWANVDQPILWNGLCIISCMARWWRIWWWSENCTGPVWDKPGFELVVDSNFLWLSQVGAGKECCWDLNPIWQLWWHWQRVIIVLKKKFMNVIRTAKICSLHRQIWACFSKYFTRPKIKEQRSKTPHCPLKFHWVFYHCNTHVKEI